VTITVAFQALRTLEEGKLFAERDHAARLKQARMLDHSCQASSG